MIAFEEVIDLVYGDILGLGEHDHDQWCGQDDNATVEVECSWQMKPRLQQWEQFQREDNKETTDRARQSLAESSEVGREQFRGEQQR